ncbi:MAG: hypothetical protein KC777_14010, partial [Cyanobacteria bacterium HKST-UBA02]|nr:hypothetical protein [Cyanobacteria bacterium HKST-UBA02]
MSVTGNELGELLIDLGLITTEDLTSAMEEQEKSGDRITLVLSRMGLVSERQLKDALELQYGVNYINLASTPPEDEFIRLIPEEIERKFFCVPVAKQGEQYSVAMVDPDDVIAADAIKSHLSSSNFKKLVCTADDFEYLMRTTYEAPAIEEESSNGGPDTGENAILESAEGETDTDPNLNPIESMLAGLESVPPEIEAEAEPPADLSDASRTPVESIKGGANKLRAAFGSLFGKKGKGAEEADREEDTIPPDPGLEEPLEKFSEKDVIDNVMDDSSRPFGSLFEDDEEDEATDTTSSDLSSVLEETIAPEHASTQASSIDSLFGDADDDDEELVGLTHPPGEDTEETVQTRPIDPEEMSDIAEAVTQSSSFGAGLFDDEEDEEDLAVSKPSTTSLFADDDEDEDFTPAAVEADVPSSSPASLFADDDEDEDFAAVVAETDVPSPSPASLFADDDEDDEDFAAVAAEADVPSPSPASLFADDEEEEDFTAVASEADVPSPSLSGLFADDDDEEEDFASVAAEPDIPSPSPASLFAEDEEDEDFAPVATEADVPSPS